MRAWVLLLLLLLTVAAAPDLTPPPGARLPLDLSFRDATGGAITIGRALNGHPAVLVFADWTCNALCGTTLGQAASVLRETGLRPGDDFVFLAIGIDPRDGPREAAAMEATEIGVGSPLSAATTFLSGDAAAVQTAMDAMGFHAVYIPEQDQFAHPAALLVLTRDGRLARIIPSFMLDAAELRNALAAAAPDSFVHRVLLICHALVATPRGAWVPEALRVGGVVTALSLGLGLLMLRRKGQRP
jgi:protein SCO1